MTSPLPRIELALTIALACSACDLYAGPQPLPGSAPGGAARAMSAPAYGTLSAPPSAADPLDAMSSMSSVSPLSPMVAGLCTGLPPADYEKCRDLLDGDDGSPPPLPKPSAGE